MRDLEREFEIHGSDVGNTADIDDKGGIIEPLEMDAGTEEAAASLELLAQCRTSLRAEGTRSTTAVALFHMFVDRWWGYVERYAARKPGIRSWEDRQDLTNRTFLRAWNWLKGQSGLAKPTTMLQHCLKIAHVDLMRERFGRQKSKDTASETVATSPGTECSPQHEQQAEELGQRPGTDPRFPLSLDAATEDQDGDLQSLVEHLPGKWTVESTVLLWELRRELREAVASLPRNYRECVECRYFDELSVRETAERLGVSEHIVEHNTTRGIALLKLKPRPED